MYAEILGKARDAGAMFWQALDAEERKIVLYVGAYLLGNVLLALNGSARRIREERLRRAILEEVRAADPA